MAVCALVRLVVTLLLTFVITSTRGAVLDYGLPADAYDDLDDDGTEVSSPLRFFWFVFSLLH